MFIDYRQLPTRSEIYCEKKRDEYLFQIQAKTPPHGWLNLFAQQQLFHLKNCVFCDSTFAVKHLSASPRCDSNMASLPENQPRLFQNLSDEHFGQISVGCGAVELWNCELHK